MLRRLLQIRRAMLEKINDLRARVGLALLLSTTASSRAHAVDALLSVPVTVQTKRGKISFLNHGIGNCKRAERLLHKEPDSLKWIDAMEPNSVFWDIGANIGTLSLYAAARGDLQVWAFEPAAVNYYDLAANCELNGFSGRMRCLLLGFGGANKLAELHVSQFMPAQSFSFVGKKEVIPTRQMAPIWTIDDFIDRYGAPFPNYIKIDVPGLTNAILAGASRALARTELRQIQIEADEHGRGGREISQTLAGFNFQIVKRNMKRGGTIQGDLVFGRESVA